MGHMFLLLWKQLIFEMFVSIDLLGPEELILLVRQQLSEYHVDPYKMFPKICHFRQNEKI